MHNLTKVVERARLMHRFRYARRVQDTANTGEKFLAGRVARDLRRREGIAMKLRA